MVETRVIGGVISEEERNAYIKRGLEKYKSDLESIDIEIDGEFVNLHYYVKPIPFQRIRRITGYLVGTLDRFNDAKRKEVEERVKHLTSK